ncbi:MAG: hypothetical protein QOI75_2500 [Pseudonocardiales bacterium]|nr:hypothetical protein [Pseudonocardiales bacterium]
MVCRGGCGGAPSARASSRPGSRAAESPLQGTRHRPGQGRLGRYPRNQSHRRRHSRVRGSGRRRGQPRSRQHRTDHQDRPQTGRHRRNHNPGRRTNTRPTRRRLGHHTPPRRTGQDRPRRKIRKTGRHCRGGPQTATPDAQERVSAGSTGTPEISTAQGSTAPRPDPISSRGGSHATSQPQAPSTQVRPVRRPPINDGRGSRLTASTTGTGENQRSSFPVRTPRGRATLRPPPQQSGPEKRHTGPDQRLQRTSPRNQPGTRPAHSNIAS